MAARINTKFLLLLITIVGALAITVAGIAFFTMRDDPSRNLKRADDFIAKGDYPAAKVQLERAWAKAETDMDIMQRFEDVLLKIQPRTASEANEYYNQLLLVKRQRIVAQPQNVELHRDYLEELYANARLTKAPGAWNQLSDAASDAMVRIGEDSEAWMVDHVFKLRADSNRSTVLSEEEIATTRQQLLDHVTSNPKDTESTNELIVYLLRESERFLLGQNEQSARASLELAEELLRAGVAANGATNPDLAIADARIVLANWFFDRDSRPTAEIDRVTDQLVNALDGNSLIVHLNEAGSILSRLKGRQGSELAISLYEDAIAARPDTFIERFLVCEQLDDLGRFDQLESFAQEIVDSDPLPVSYLATYRFELRKEAAKMLFDAANARLSQATASERADLLAEAREARDFLDEITAENDIRVFEADGWLALAENDPRRAASKFNEVVTRNTRPSVRVLWGFGRALQATGASGEAADVFRQALQVNPANVSLMIELARLEGQLGNADAAREILADAKDVAPDNETVDLLLSGLDANEGNAVANPLVQMMREAQDFASAGDLDAARELLTAANKEYPLNSSVIALLTRVEIDSGLKDQAVNRLEKLVEQYPANPDLLNLTMEVRGDDRIERIERVLALKFPDNQTKLIAQYAVAFSNEAKQEFERADELDADGLVDEATKARQLAERLAAKGDDYRQQADSLGATELAFLDHQFSEAIQAGNIDEAKRIADRARTANADQANGLSFEARLQIADGAFENAVITLDDITQKKPYDPWAWRTLGQVYQEIGNLTDAKQSYERAYDVRPNDVNTVIAYSQFLVDTGDMQSALVLLRESANRMPQNQQMQERWLRLEGQIGNPATAIEFRSDKFDREPDNQVNAVRLIELLGKTDPQRSTIVDENGEPIFDDREWSSLGSRQRNDVIAEKRAAWDELAENVLTTLESNAQSEFGPVFARATFYRNRGRVDDGAQLLEDFIAAKEEDGSATDQLYIAASSFHSAINDLTAAYNWLMRGLPNQDDSKRTIDLALAQGFADDGNHQKALEHLKRFAEVNDSKDIQVTILQNEVNIGEYQSATKRLRSIREIHGNSQSLELLEAGIYSGEAANLLQAGKTNEANRVFVKERAAINRAIAIDSSDPWPFVQRARSIIEEFRRAETPRFVLLEDAMGDADRALEINSNFVPALKVRAQIRLSQQPPDVIAAVSDLRRALELDPLDNRLRTNTIRVLVADEQYSTAMQLAQNGMEAQPRSETWARAIGELHELQNNDEEALAAFRKTFELSGQPGDLVRWSRVKLAGGGQTAAQEVLTKLGQHEEMIATSPALQTTAAHALKVVNRWDDARKAMQGAFTGYKRVAELSNRPRAIEVWYTELFNLFEGKPGSELAQFIFETVGDEPNYVDLYWAGKAWLFRDPDGASQAAELFAQSLEKMGPDDQGRSDVYISLGQSKFVMGDHQGAVDAYREAIKDDPNNASVLNDMAYIMAVNLDQAEDALPLAERAVEAMPNNANVLDTLGTVQLELGQLDEAERTLTKSINIQPMAGNQFHLAKVFIGLDRSREAEQLLIAAQNSNPDQAMADDIKALLADIQ